MKLSFFFLSFLIVIKSNDLLKLFLSFLRPLMRWAMFLCVFIIIIVGTTIHIYVACVFIVITQHKTQPTSDLKSKDICNAKSKMQIMNTFSTNQQQHPQRDDLFFCFDHSSYVFKNLWKCSITSYFYDYYQKNVDQHKLLRDWNIDMNQKYSRYIFYPNF